MLVVLIIYSPDGVSLVMLKFNHSEKERYACWCRQYDRWRSIFSGLMVKLILLGR